MAPLVFDTNCSIVEITHGWCFVSRPRCKNLHLQFKWYISSFQHNNPLECHGICTSFVFVFAWDTLFYSPSNNKQLKRIREEGKNYKLESLSLSPVFSTWMISFTLEHDSFFFLSTDVTSEVSWYENNQPKRNFIPNSICKVLSSIWHWIYNSVVQCFI